MKSLELFSAHAPILGEAEAEPIPPVEGTMSLTVFMALFILGLDLLIYAFFRRVYSDRLNCPLMY
jgi:hypothetical protein